MTVSDISNIKTYTGNGSTTDFSSVFTFYASSELIVSVDGSVKVLDTDYTVTGGSGSTGTIAFGVAPANNTAVMIKREVDYDQETDFANFNGYPADVAEKQYDLNVMQAQQLKTLSLQPEVITIVSSSNAITVDLNLGRVFKHVFTEDTTFTFSNTPATGFETRFRLYLTNDSTARTPTWPSSVDWTAATAPTFTTNSEVKVLEFSTIDGGTTWYGNELMSTLG